MPQLSGYGPACGVQAVSAQQETSSGSWHGQNSHPARIQKHPRACSRLSQMPKAWSVLALWTTPRQNPFGSLWRRRRAPEPGSCSAALVVMWEFLKVAQLCPNSVCCSEQTKSSLLAACCGAPVKATHGAVSSSAALWAYGISCSLLITWLGFDVRWEMEEYCLELMNPLLNPWAVSSRGCHWMIQSDP